MARLALKMGADSKAVLSIIAWRGKPVADDVCVIDGVRVSDAVEEAVKLAVGLCDCETLGIALCVWDTLEVTLCVCVWDCVPVMDGVWLTDAAWLAELDTDMLAVPLCVCDLDWVPEKDALWLVVAAWVIELDSDTVRDCVWDCDALGAHSLIDTRLDARKGCSAVHELPLFTEKKDANTTAVPLTGRLLDAPDETLWRCIAGEADMRIE
jgi:hypothetical protein